LILIWFYGTAKLWHKSLFFLRRIVILFIALAYSHFSFSTPSLQAPSKPYFPKIHYTAKNLDALWSDYFATKNPSDLLKIIKFISDNDDFL